MRFGGRAYFFLVIFGIAAALAGGAPKKAQKARPAAVKKKAPPAAAATIARETITPATLRAAILALEGEFGAEYAGAEYLAKLERIGDGAREQIGDSPRADIPLGTVPDLGPRADIPLGTVPDLGARADIPLGTVPDLGALAREALVLGNPLLRGREILYVSRKQYPPDHHNTETMFQTGEINTASFEAGGALKALDPATGRTRTLLETREGLIRDPEVHFDGGKIVFSMRRNKNEDYKIFEINRDGGGLRQLTRARGVFDIDPLYLPDDTIAFSSSREPKYCMCNVHIMANLYRMEPDGANIRQIGKNTLFEGHGSVMDDGRILYDRWEYVDRNFGDAQGLWTVNPDGTNHAVWWGNNTPSPGAVIDARMIPGTQRAIAVLGSCHDRPWGALGIIDRRLGLDGRAPIVRTWPAAAADLATTAGEILFDRYKAVMPKYEDPFALGGIDKDKDNDKDNDNDNDWGPDGKGGAFFLCSRMVGRGEQMGIYLIDVFGNEILLCDEAPGCFDPMPLAPRARPAAVAERIDLRAEARTPYPSDEGTFYVQDVYRGTAMQGVRRGEVKALRVVEEPEKRQWTHPAWGGQGVERPAMNWHDFNSKRILGTAPVEADGSAYFKVPAGRFVYFQLLDEKGFMVQSMRSGAILQPGERAGCVGCHEARLATPPAHAPATALALRRAPSTLAPWHGPERAFNYLAEVQPVLDKFCVKCHDYGTAAGKKLLLAGDRDLVFNTSYIELWRKGLTGAIGAGPPQIQAPGAWGSRASGIVKAMLKCRAKYGLDDASIERVATWVDLNAPYYPDYATAWPDGLAGRAPLEAGQLKRLGELAGVDFAKWATHNGNTGPMVSFERPELSPCLAALKGKDEVKYADALEIIRAGARALAARPGPDAPGFAACETDRKREEKYQALAQREQKNREAIRAGKKVYDSGF